MLADRTQYRQASADQMQELTARVDAIEVAIGAMSDDRKWIVRLLADIAVDREVGS